MVVGLILGFPHIQDIQAKGWYVYITYETEFFRLAKSLAEFKPILTHPVLGFPIFLVPFIWIFRAEVIEDILLPVVLFHSVLFFGMSVLLVASIAKTLSNENKKVALLSTGLWVILPYLIYLIVLFNPRLACLDITQKRTFYLMWTTLLDDPLYSFLIILGVYIFIKSLNHRDKISYSILVGILFGFASLVNPLTSTVIGISFILIFLFMKYIRAFTYSVITFGMFGIPQLVYNWYFNGSPFNFLAMGPEIALSYNGKVILKNLALSNIIFSLNRIRERFDISFYHYLLFWFLLILISIIYILKKKDKSKILVIWIVPHLCFIILYSGFSFSILECLLSILPAIIIMFSIVTVDMGDYLLNLRRKAN